MDKKYWIGLVSALIIIPALAFSRDRIALVWASPDKVAEVEKKVYSYQSTQEQLSKLVLEQQVRMDKDDAVQKVQLEALKEQLSIISELKKKR